MKKVYALTIMNGKDIDFQCLISEDGKYFRVQIDELDYETMINELLSDGYISVERVGTQKINVDGVEYERPIYKENHISFHTPQEIYKALLEDGFDCKLESQDNFVDVLEVSVDGQDLGIEVITATNKMKINTAANYLFKAINNEDYEPVEREKSGSYSLVLSDSKITDTLRENLFQILDELKNTRINVEKFFEKGYYYSFLISFIEIAKMRHLDVLTLKMGDSIDEKITLNKLQLLAIKQEIERVQMTKPFRYTKTKDDWLDAFELIDNGEGKFKLHSINGFENGKQRVCYVENKDLYEKIQQNSQEIIDFKGFYKSATRTVKIESVNIYSQEN